MDGEKYSDLFKPILSFVNQRQNRRQDFYGDSGSTFQYFWHKSPHYFEYAEYHIVTVGCVQPTHNFPFDSQECYFQFYDPEKSQNFCKFDIAVISGKSEVQIKNHGLDFDIKAESIETNVIKIESYEYDTAGLLFKFKKVNVWAIITGYFLPTGIYSVLSGLSFTIPREQVNTLVSQNI